MCRARSSRVQQILSTRKVKRRNAILKDRDLLHTDRRCDCSSYRGIKKHSRALRFLCRALPGEVAVELVVLDSSRKSRLQGVHELILRMTNLRLRGSVAHKAN